MKMCYRRFGWDMALLLVVYILFGSYIDWTNGYEVLVIYHPIAKSHSMFLHRTAKDLEDRGHKLTLIHTPLTRPAVKHPVQTKSNLTIFPLVEDDEEDHLQNVLDQLLWSNEISLLETYKIMFSLVSTFAKQCKLIDNQSLRSTLSQKKFDLVLSDPTFTPCLLALTAQVSAPNIETVGISFLVTQAFAHGISFPFSYATGHLLPYGRDSLRFRQRILNSIDLSSNLALEYFFFLYSSLKISNFSMGYMYSRVGNISGYFVNDNIHLQPPRPQLSSLHLIGGPEMNLDSNAASEGIPEHLRTFIEESGSHRGLIIMSLSTMSPSTQMHPQFKRTFLKTFARLNRYRIIWRYEGEVPEAQVYDHIRILPWIPLKALLEHNRTVLMVTHGGINSVMEGMYYGVPLLGIPLYGDQASVLSRIRDWGAAEILPKHQLTTTSFNKTLLSMLSNDRLLDNQQRERLHAQRTDIRERLRAQKTDIRATSVYVRQHAGKRWELSGAYWRRFMTNMKRCQKLMQDRIISPKEEGTFWTEHLMRHRGRPQKWKIKSNSLHLSEYYSLDSGVPSALLLAVLITFLAVK